VWYGRAALRRRRHRLARRVLLPLTGILLLLGVPATGPAQDPGIDTLRQKSASLAAGSQQVLIELYGLASRLSAARANLARLDAQAVELARRHASARTRYRAARRTLTAAQTRLGQQIRLLYEQDQPDPLAIVLGATSLQQAIDGLESIKRTTRMTESVIRQSIGARNLIDRVRSELAAQLRRTQAARAQAARVAVDLERARADRSSYLDRLRGEQELTANQLSLLQRQAQEAQQHSARITLQAVASASPESLSDAAAAPSEQQSAPPAAAPNPPRPGATMDVQATGYCLRGTTATGLPVGPGIVAVDPNVIPLGTRMIIPGYGTGVAADTGGAIKGARIDVWLVSCNQAAAFGGTIRIAFQ
jgi:3D (Asp-Asp-Asp) domain-containing protein